jgi:hypothetical protein
LQLSPATAAISHLSFGLPIGSAGLLFSEKPVCLRSSGLHQLGTVLEIRTFRVTYNPARKEVLRLFSRRRESPISKSAPLAPGTTSGLRPTIFSYPLQTARIIPRRRELRRYSGEETVSGRTLTAQRPAAGLISACQLKLPRP